MTKKELIKALEKYDDYDVVIFKDENGGWSNIEVVDGLSGPAIVCDYTLPFSDE